MSSARKADARYITDQSGSAFPAPIHRIAGQSAAANARRTNAGRSVSLAASPRRSAAMQAYTQAWHIGITTISAMAKHATTSGGTARGSTMRTTAAYDRRRLGVLARPAATVSRHARGNERSPFAARQSVGAWQRGTV